MGGWIASEYLISIAWVDLDLFERLQVACEIGRKVPAHRIDVRLGDLPSQCRVGFREIAEKVFELHETLLLNNLRVDIGRSHGSDL